jgi:hypothetical protein
MGGLGSGRQGWRIKAEECCRLDIRYLHRRGTLVSGWRSYGWNRGGEPAGSINYIGNGDSITLDYRSREYGGDWVPMRYEVLIEWTPCNYGGSRPWFLCPNCRRRVAVLYLPGTIAACRKCYNISYSSQCEDFSGRAMRRMGKIEARLGEPGNNDFPPKPKRMRWTTYERLAEKYQEADWQSMAGIMKLMERFGGGF